MTEKRSWPLGVKYENREHVQPIENTQVRLVQNWPDPEVRGQGVVISKDGKVKTDGSNIKQCGG